MYRWSRGIAVAERSEKEVPRERWLLAESSNEGRSWGKDKRKPKRMEVRSARNPDLYFFSENIRKQAKQKKANQP